MVATMCRLPQFQVSFEKENLFFLGFSNRNLTFRSLHMVATNFASMCTLYRRSESHFPFAKSEGDRQREGGGIDTHVGEESKRYTYKSAQGALWNSLWIAIKRYVCAYAISVYRNVYIHACTAFFCWFSRLVQNSWLFRQWVTLSVPHPVSLLTLMCDQHVSLVIILYLIILYLMISFSTSENDHSLPHPCQSCGGIFSAPHFQSLHSFFENNVRSICVALHFWAGDSPPSVQGAEVHLL